MIIKVLLFGKLRELAQTSETNIIMNDTASLSTLLEKIAERYGELFKENITYIQELRILVNGREYQTTGGLETLLKDKDTVVLLPPLMGG